MPPSMESSSGGMSGVSSSQSSERNVGISTSLGNFGLRLLWLPRGRTAHQSRQRECGLPSGPLRSCSLAHLRGERCDDGPYGAVENNDGAGLAGSTEFGVGVVDGAEFLQLRECLAEGVAVHTAECLAQVLVVELAAVANKCGQP